MMMSFLFVFQLWADGGAVMRAKSLEELQNASEAWRIELQRQESCILEKKNQWFPENCLFWLDHKLGNVSGLQIAPQAFADLGALCRETSDQLVDLSQIRNLKALATLPEPCLQVIDGRWKDLQYQRSKELGPNIELNDVHDRMASTESVLSN